MSSLSFVCIKCVLLIGTQTVDSLVNVCWLVDPPCYTDLNYNHICDGPKHPYLKYNYDNAVLFLKVIHVCENRLHTMNIFTKPGSEAKTTSFGLFS